MSGSALIVIRELFKKVSRLDGEGGSSSVTLVRLSAPADLQFPGRSLMRWACLMNSLAVVVTKITIRSLNVLIRDAKLWLQGMEF